MNYINLITCNNEVEANLIKGRLESNGIQCFLTNPNTTTMLPYLNGMLGAGVQVMVSNEDAERSLEIIKDSLQDNSGVPQVCPNCKSNDVRFGLGKKSYKKVLTIILSALFFLPFGNLRHRFYCAACGNTDFSKEQVSNPI